MKVNYFCFLMIGLIVGMQFTEWLADTGLENNTIEGYHCTPITKHTGIESAKAQVVKYQTMVRG